MKINIPFNDWSKEQLSNFTKNATSRTKQYGDSGDTFDVEDKRYEIQFVVPLPLWFIAEFLHTSEGCISKTEFIKIWSDIHPRAGWTPDKKVYYHYFKCVGGGL